jgi:Nif-specific regulatory protein
MNEVRPDLYSCLSTFTIYVPSLRQRKEEIPLLIDYFMRR